MKSFFVLATMGGFLTLFCSFLRLGGGVGSSIVDLSMAVVSVITSGDPLSAELSLTITGLSFFVEGWSSVSESSESSDSSEWLSW